MSLTKKRQSGLQIIDLKLVFFETETRTSLLIRTPSTRELYKESQKVVNKGDLEGSGGTPGHLN